MLDITGCPKILLYLPNKSININLQKVKFLILKSNVRKISQSILLFCIVCIYYIWFSNWKLEVCIFWVVSCLSAGGPLSARPAGQSTELGWRAGRARLLMLRCRTPLHFSPESIRLQQGRAFVTPSLSSCPGRQHTCMTTLTMFEIESTRESA